LALIVELPPPNVSNPGVDPPAFIVTVPPVPLVAALAVKFVPDVIDMPPLIPPAPRLVIVIVPPFPDVVPPFVPILTPTDNAL
jgi:hypothetical protein